jgi:phage gp36-like protein
MAYTTKAAIIAKISEATLVQLTDDEGDGSEVDSRVAAAISEAEGMIDGYLRGRWATPLAEPVPEPIPSIATDLAIFALFERRGDFLISDKVIERKKRAEKKLEQIQAGTISFLGNGSPAIYATRSTLDRVFTSERMDRY